MEQLCSRHARILQDDQMLQNYAIKKLQLTEVIQAQLSTAQPPVVWDLAK